MPSPAERAAAIAAKAREREQAAAARQRPKSAPEDPPDSGYLARHRWRIYWPNGVGEIPIYRDVWLPEPITQPELRGACGCDCVPTP